MRGDEPVLIFGPARDGHVFPACAGMNRTLSCRFLSQLRVPRMRGDEPLNLTARVQPFRCSPHARG